MHSHSGTIDAHRLSVPALAISQHGGRHLPCNLQHDSEAVGVEAAHGREVVGEGAGVSGLHLLNQELDVGGNEFLFGVGRLAAKGGRVGEGGCAAHGVLLGFGFGVGTSALSADVHAERLLAKAGVARRRGRGLPILGAKRKGRSAAEVCTSRRRGRLGKPLAPRDRGRALARFSFLIRARQRTEIKWVGVAGRNRPAEVGGGRRPASGDGEETSSRMSQNQR
jgi:hypothetical protein